MKKLLEVKKGIFFIALVIILRLVILYGAELFGNTLIKLRTGYIGHAVWGNFDGIHYIGIAEHGYARFQQAFFPLFPLLINFFGRILDSNYFLASFLLVDLAFLLTLFAFYKLVTFDYDNKVAFWAIIFLLLFPTSFFFNSLYTESIFLSLALGSFYFARKHRWVIASLLAGLASSVKFVGIFLLPALLIEFYMAIKNKKVTKQYVIKTVFTIIILSVSGLLSYMVYLGKMFQDPIFFIHAQPAFGANRTGGEIILLPQVLFRYIKILMTIPVTNYDFWIALLEIAAFSFASIILILYWRKIRPSYLVFSILAIVIPTFTGTLSSEPRYILVSFPIFIILALVVKGRLKVFTLTIFSMLLFILVAFFLRGHFIA